MDFLTHLLDSSSFMPRADSGGWTSGLIWLHIICDCLIWIAFMAIGGLLVYFVRRRKDVPFSSMFMMFGAFIIACGFTHFMEVVTFTTPVYRLSGLLKLITALLSWATVIALVPLVPKALVLRSPKDLEREIIERQKVEKELVRQAESLKEQAQLLDLAHETIMVRDMGGMVTYWNRGAEEMYGWKRAHVLGHDKHRLLQTRFPRPFREIEDELFRDGYCEVELEQTRANGETLTVASRWALQRDEYGCPKAVLEINRDITAHKRAQVQLRTDAERMAQVAELGRRALSGTESESLIQDCVAFVRQTLSVDYVGVFENRPVPGDLVLRAAAGWDDGLIGKATVPGGNESLAGYALETQQLIIAENFNTEARFRVSQFEREQQVAGGTAVVIYTGGEAMGTLVAESTRRHIFSWADVHFLQAIANIVGMASDHRQAQEVGSSPELGPERSNGKTQDLLRAAPAATSQHVQA
jgi:PAS domain S-box-containing protein